MAEQHDILSTLSERGKNYGEFSEQARICQTLKFCLTQTINWNNLSADKREALEMIVHKIARILNGNPEYEDSWHDIAGYATLIVNDLKQRKESIKEQFSH